MSTTLATRQGTAFFSSRKNSLAPAYLRGPSHSLRTFFAYVAASKHTIPDLWDVLHPSKPALSGLPLNEKPARRGGGLGIRRPKKPSLRHSQYQGADHHRRLLDHTQNRPPGVANVLDSTIPSDTGWSSSRTPVALAGHDRPPEYERPVQSCWDLLSSAQRRCHPGPDSTAATSQLAPRPPRVLVGSRGRPDMRISGAEVAERADTRRVQVS
ncbi:hypothetical protein K466DRAFT_299501 [Polyporus arcularius HHB13444]|uniref:Uncharacterized protein n=1 Tax=Polyporus arcularius HHB13444 TaxID=1314778 RepID=A0A5C3P105_9APHY|nr:hypothetical protein K466DRAFT_299501 [Polyporus arcularius HHB13444]